MKGMSHVSMTDEQKLVSQILEGDRHALNMLIKKYERLVAHMVFRIVESTEDREEICQDVFIKVYQSLPRFNFKSKLSTWIGTIAYRHALNSLKKKKKIISANDPFSSENDCEAQFIDHQTPEKILSKSDTKAIIHQLIETLPVQYRTIITLFHLEEMSYPEIVKITGMPEGTVKNYLFRARKQLKEKLKHYIVKEELL